MNDTQRKKDSHIVLEFDRCDTRFLVQEIINPRKVWLAGNFMVRLDEIWCACDKFQKVHMSCSHVVTACKHAHHEYKNYIHLVYMLKSVSNVYRELCNETYWSPCHKPKIKRNFKGRHVSSYIHTEMDI